MTHVYVCQLSIAFMALIISPSNFLTFKDFKELWEPRLKYLESSIKTVEPSSHLSMKESYNNYLS